jgi:hypothetical protein
MAPLATESYPRKMTGNAADEATRATAENYRRFARLEAAGRSPAYEQLALAVAGDAAILAFLQCLPPAKRQPNLLFAAARWILGAVWLSNEAPGVLPDVTVPPGDDGASVLIRDGTQALARTDPHGTRLTWLP